MKIELKNKQLAAINNFLYKLKMSNKQSRSRSKFIKILLRKHEEFLEDVKEITKSYAELDEHGELVQVDKNQFKVAEKNLLVCQNELDELGEESAIIEGGEYVNRFEELYETLKSLEFELESSDAEAYDSLLDAFETAENKTKEEK